MSSVEDKLTKFQFVCEDKLKKIELLKVQHEKNEKILLSFETDYQRRYDLAKLNLKLAQKQLELEELRRSNREEKLLHAQIIKQTKELDDDLTEAFEQVDDMTSSIPDMLDRLHHRIGELTDLVVACRESCLMNQEEARTLSTVIQQTTQHTQSDQQINWLERLVSATRIQNQDLQRKLDILLRNNNSL